MTDTSLVVRPYAEGDEREILSLFREAFGRDLPPEFWRWRFADNPAGPILIDLMWAGDTLAGHYAASPVMLDTEAGPMATALSMTTMTSAAFKGRGIFPALATSLYTRMAETGFAMVWGFPNANSHRGFVTGLEWRDIHEIPTFRLDLGHSTPEADIAVAEVTTFDLDADDLWARVGGRMGAVLTRRDQRYLNWRYVQHPTNDYRVLAARVQSGLAGFIVTKGYGGELDIVDLLGEDTDTMFQLVLGALELARSQDAVAVNMWLPLAHPLHPMLERIGFGLAGPVTYFGARRLGAISDAVFDIRSWFLTMGDSDVY